MCVILFVSLTTKKFKNRKAVASNRKIEKRGPDFHVVERDANKKNWIGFNRLSINDLSDDGNQPFKSGNLSVVCNGEIYNFESLKKIHNITTNSNSDCEIIPYMYRNIGIDSTIRSFDGVFAFIIYDKTTNTTIIGRDPIGVRPVFYQMDHDFNIAAASEAKSLTKTGIGEIKQVPAGSYMIFHNNSMKIYKYFTLVDKPIHIPNDDEKIICDKIRELLIDAVDKRLLSDREIGCFLSGGVDSSIIASILARKYKEKGLKIKTFSIGFEGSPDIKNAQIVADHIGSDHYQFIVTQEDALKYIDRVIYNTETYDITTVRASTPMFMLSEIVSKTFDEKVIFSGEGADELMAGYLYFHSTSSNHRIFNESKRLIEELPYFDVLRADRCTASHGIELRVPFLDKTFVKFTTSLAGKVRKPQNGIEKYHLRKAFEGYIPDEILWRRKDGFSDGVGGLEKGWPEYIKEYVEDKVPEFTKIDKLQYMLSLIHI